MTRLIACAGVLALGLSACSGMNSTEQRTLSGGAIGAGTALTLADCVPRINAWAAAARAVRPQVLVLCHGGPIATPEDAQWILARCPDCHGFYGASSMERLPVETALTEQTRAFKRITF